MNVCLLVFLVGILLPQVQGQELHTIQQKLQTPNRSRTRIVVNGYSPGDTSFIAGTAWIEVERTEGEDIREPWNVLIFEDETNDAAREKVCQAAGFPAGYRSWTNNGFASVVYRIPREAMNQFTGIIRDLRCPAEKGRKFPEDCEMRVEELSEEWLLEGALLLHCQGSQGEGGVVGTLSLLSDYRETGVKSGRTGTLAIGHAPSRPSSPPHLVCYDEVVSEAAANITGDIICRMNRWRGMKSITSVNREISNLTHLSGERINQLGWGGSVIDGLMCYPDEHSITPDWNSEREWGCNYKPGPSSCPPGNEMVLDCQTRFPFTEVSITAAELWSVEEYGSTKVQVGKRGSLVIRWNTGPSGWYGYREEWWALVCSETYGRYMTNKEADLFCVAAGFARAVANRKHYNSRYRLPGPALHTNPPHPHSGSRIVGLDCPYNLDSLDECAIEALPSCKIDSTVVLHCSENPKVWDVVGVQLQSNPGGLRELGLEGTEVVVGRKGTVVVWVNNLETEETLKGLVYASPDMDPAVHNMLCELASSGVFDNATVARENADVGFPESRKLSDGYLLASGYRLVVEKIECESSYLEDCDVVVNPCGQEERDEGRECLTGVTTDNALYLECESS